MRGEQQQFSGSEKIRRSSGAREGGSSRRLEKGEAAVEAWGRREAAGAKQEGGAARERGRSGSGGWRCWRGRAPPCRPGRGGGQRWRRSRGREMEMLGPKGIGAAARDFDPSSSLPLF